MRRKRKERIPFVRFNRLNDISNTLKWTNLDKQAPGKIEISFFETFKILKEVNLLKSCLSK